MSLFKTLRAALMITLVGMMIYIGFFYAGQSASQVVVIVADAPERGGHRAGDPAGSGKTTGNR